MLVGISQVGCGATRLLRACEDPTYLELAQRSTLSEAESRVLDSLNKKCWEHYNWHKENDSGQEYTVEGGSSTRETLGWIAVTFMVIGGIGAYLLLSALF